MQPRRAGSAQANCSPDGGTRRGPEQARRRSVPPPGEVRLGRDRPKGGLLAPAELDQLALRRDGPMDVAARLTPVPQPWVTARPPGLARQRSRL